MENNLFENIISKIDFDNESFTKNDCCELNKYCYEKYKIFNLEKHKSDPLIKRRADFSDLIFKFLADKKINTTKNGLSILNTIINHYTLLIKD